jgi:hypothetical protein
VHGLVEGPLQERRVERDDGSHAAHREARRERDECCSAIPTSMKRFGKRLLEGREARPGRHPGRDRDDPLVRLARATSSFTKTAV